MAITRAGASANKTAFVSRAAPRAAPKRTPATGARGPPGGEKGQQAGRTGHNRERVVVDVGVVHVDDLQSGDDRRCEQPDRATLGHQSPGQQCHQRNGDDRHQQAGEA